MKKYKLGDIANIIGGVAFQPCDVCKNGIRVLRGGNIQAQSIVTKENDLFLPSSYKNKENQLQIGDTVIVASTGSVEVLGKAATCFKELPNTQIGAFLRIVRPKEKCYAMLISIALNSSHFAKYIKSQAKGTSINNITLTHLTNYTFFFPASSQLIGNLYQSIEKKIALNRSINHNLEAMAKQLYDYWFVQFDFPDENGMPYKSSGGKMVWNEKLKREIPVGWSDGQLSDIANIIMGQSPDGSSYNEVGNGKIFYQGSTDFGIRFPSIRQYTTAPTRFAKKRDILMSVRAPVGATNIANNDCCIGRGLAALNSKVGSITHLYYIIDGLKTAFDQRNAAGTTFGSITKDDLFVLPVVVPNTAVLLSFEKVCSAFFEKQMIIGEEIDLLTKLRDSLLPLLMNGQVSVNYDLSND